MLINRGKVLEKVFKASGFSLTELSKRVAYDRTTVYRHFAKPDIEFPILIKYGKALNHDFTVEFPELSNYFSQIEEPINAYTTHTLAEALKERDIWKDKYIRLLEKHNALILKSYKINED
jgi:predicted RNase H-like HicB family nuclease